MWNYLEEHGVGGFYLVFRFIIVFLLTVFGILALGTELDDVFNAYLGIDLAPLEALFWVAIAYLAGGTTFVFGSLMSVARQEGEGRDFSCSEILILGLLFLGLPGALALRAYEVFHPFNINYIPGELSRAKFMLTLITALFIVLEALGTAYYDLRRSLSTRTKWVNLVDEYEKCDICSDGPDEEE